MGVGKSNAYEWLMEGRLGCRSKREGYSVASFLVR